MTARVDAASTGWRLAPGVRRLRDGRLLGGSPMRVIRLGSGGEDVLAGVLGRVDHPAPDTATALLTDRLQRYGFLDAPLPPAGPITDVTVVIPARASVSDIWKLLDRLPDIPVVLVDDASTVSLQKRVGPRVDLTHVRHERSLGPAAARNAGARLATTTWLAFIDADVLPTRESLAQLAFYTKTYRGVVAVGPRIRNRKSGGLAGLMETYCGALDLGAVACDVRPGARACYLSTAFLLVDRVAFERVGGFDPSLRVAEDVDLIWRLAGYGRVRYEPAVVVGHAPRTSARDVLFRRKFYGTGAALLEQRHPGLIRHADVSVWSLAPWALAVGVHPLVGLVAGLAVISVAPRRVPDLSTGDALRLVVNGEVAGWLALCRWLVRPLWPLTLAVAVAVPARRSAMIAVCMAGYADVCATAWQGDPAASQPPRSPRVVLSTLVGQTLADLAYSAGVWQGCLRHHRLAPLLPRVRRPRPTRDRS